MNETNPVARTCVLVLGMHRSGTSAVARMVSLMGAALPKTLMGASESNEAGHWEPKTLVELNEQMLLEGGSAWNDWRPFQPLKALGPLRYAHYRAELSRQIEEEYAGEALFVLKDPRISRFAPLYLDCLAALGIGVKVVLISRHPLEVAGSLLKRDSMPQDFAMRLWLRHNLDAEATTRDQDRIVIDYDSALSDPDAAIAQLQGLIAPVTAAGANVDIAGARASLRGELRHHASEGSEQGPKASLLEWAEEAEAAYLALSRDGGEARALADLDVLRTLIDEDLKQNGETLTYALGDALRARAELIDVTRQRNAMIERARELEAHEAQLVSERDELMRQRNVMIERAHELEAHEAQLVNERDELMRQRNVMIERTHELEAHEAQLVNERDELMRQRNVMIERAKEFEAHEAQLVNERDELMRQRNVMIERTQELEALAINTSEFDDIMRQRNAMIERAKELETHGSVVAHDRDDMMRQRNILLRRTQELEMRERALETHNRDLETNKTELEARMKDLDGCLSEVLQAFAERRRQHIIDLASTEHPDYGEKPPKQLWPWRSLNAEKRDRIRKLRDDYLTVLKSPLFDSEYYLTKYPDVAESGQDPILHYLRHGWHEGRWPSAAIDPVECENFFPELKQSQGNLVLRLIALLGPIVDEP